MSTSINLIFSFFDNKEPIDDFPDPIMPNKTKFSFEFINFCIEKTQLCLNLNLTNVICNLQEIQVRPKEFMVQF